MPIGALLGGIAGELWGGQDDDEYLRLLQQNLYGTASLGGEMAPGVTTIEDNPFAARAGSPEARAAQMDALNYFLRSGAAGGMTPEDRAANEEVAARVATDDRGRRGAIMQHFAARGRGGTAAELQNLQAGAAASADRQRAAGFQTAADARQRALQAMAQGGALAGNIRGQDVDEQNDVAGAQDSINRFNATAANTYAQANASRRLQWANDVNQARGNVAGFYGDRGQRRRNIATGVGRAADQVVGSIAGGMAGGPAGAAAGGSAMGKTAPPGGPAAPRWTGKKKGAAYG